MGGGQSSENKKQIPKGFANFDKPLDDSIRESKYPLKPFSKKTFYIQLSEKNNMTVDVTKCGLTVDWLYSTFLEKVSSQDKTFDQTSKRPSFLN